MICTDDIRFRQSIIWAVVILVLSIMAIAPAHAASRVALVIGNGGYAHVQSLRNPARDAADMAARLEELGFEVVLGIDTDRQEFGELLTKTLERSKSADAVIFYYAGHGFEVSGINRLVPVDAVLRDRARIADETIDMNGVIEALNGRGQQLVVLLDACRNNPLPQGVRLATDSEGLAKIEGGRDVFVAFATEPRQVAGDGTGRNSAFTKALLTHMDRPGLSVADMMVDVRRDVFASTKGKQLPWDQSSLKSAFYFVPNLLLTEQVEETQPETGDDTLKNAGQSRGTKNVGTARSSVVEPLEPGDESLIVGVEPEGQQQAALEESAGEDAKKATRPVKYDDYRLLCAECKAKVASTVSKARALAKQHSASVVCVFAATPNVVGKRQNLGFACGREKEGRSKFAAMAQSACRKGAAGSDMVEGKYCRVISQQVLKPANRATKSAAPAKKAAKPAKTASAKVIKPSSKRPGALLYGWKLWPQGTMSRGQVNRTATEYGKLYCRTIDRRDEVRTCFWKS